MLGDTDIVYTSLANNKILRKWVVDSVLYDNDFDGYFTYTLGDEYQEFGTPYAAYNYAKNLVRKYKKKWSDARVVVKEIPVNGYVCGANE